MPTAKQRRIVDGCHKVVQLNNLLHTHDSSEKKNRMPFYVEPFIFVHHYKVLEVVRLGPVHFPTLLPLLRAFNVYDE